MNASKTSSTSKQGSLQQEALQAIVKTIEKRFLECGPSANGLFWPNAKDIARRYEVALFPLLADIERTGIDEVSLSLLDFGCGIGFLPDWLAANNFLHRLIYLGLDASEVIVREARRRWPSLQFVVGDIFHEQIAELEDKRFDIVIACGIFTARFSLTETQMLDYTKATLERLWQMTDRCLVFNAMSRHVDWTREDLFHWGVDDVLAFASTCLSRHVDVMGAYGLWEHTYRIWRHPHDMRSLVPKDWR